MFNLLLVGIGGFFGTICRYALQGWVYRFFDDPWIPYGTLAVNVVGCLLIGFLNGMVEFRQVLNPEMRLILFLGFLGGFTTYSTFVYETFALARDQQMLAALTNIGLQLALGLGAVWLGHVLARLL